MRVSLAVCSATPRRSFHLTQVVRADNPYNDDNCDHHRIAGVQSGGVVDTRDGNIAEGHPFHNYGAGGCANAYGSQICRCASSAFCEVQSDYPYSWVDITEAGVGTLITDWEQNADDGW